MKIILSILLIAALSFLAGMFLPWWSIAIIAFLITILLPLKPGLAFLAGFAGIFLLWGVLAIWIDVRNNGVLSHRLAQVLPLGGSAALLILVTAVVGGLVGGFASLAGSGLRPARRRRAL